MTSPSDLASDVERQRRHEARMARRLARHLQAGAIGETGKHLRRHLTRVELWEYDPDTGVMRRATSRTVKVWGWTAREVQRLLVRALEADRVRKMAALRAKAREQHGAKARVQGVVDGDRTLGASVAEVPGEPDFGGSPDGGGVAGEPQSSGGGV